MTKTWHQKLVDLHPELFVRTFRGITVAPGFPTCGDGWCDIVTKVVERVSAAAAGQPIHFTQILERHGRLLVYWRAEGSLPKHIERTIEEAIALAEARSACSCVASPTICRSLVADPTADTAEFPAAAPAPYGNIDIGL